MASSSGIPESPPLPPILLTTVNMLEESLEMRKLFKYLPILMEMMPHFQVITDDEVTIQEKADHVLQMLGILAEESDTDLDDLLVDRVRELLSEPEFWDTIDRLIEFFQGEKQMSFGALMEQEEKNLNPATILLIVEVVGLLVKMWRNR